MNRLSSFQSFVAMLLIFTVCFCSFDVADRTVSNFEISSSVKAYRGDLVRNVDVIALKDNKYAITFAHSTTMPYVSYVKNGANLFTVKQYNTGTSYNQGTNGIRVGDYLLLNYGLSSWFGMRWLNDDNTGSFVNSPITVSYNQGNKIRQQMIILGDDQTLGICLNSENGGTNLTDIDCYSVALNPSGPSQTITHKGRLNVHRLNEQILWDMLKVEANRNIIMTYANGSPSSSTDYYLYFYEVSDDIDTWQDRTMTQIPNTLNYKLPRIKATGDGGFLLMAVDTDNSQIKCMRFDKTNTISVSEQIVYEFGKTVDFAIHQDTAYVVVVSTKTGEENDLLGMEVNIHTCQRTSVPVTITSEEIENYPAIDINIDSGNVTMGVAYNVKTGANTYKIKFSEYDIDTTGIPTCMYARCQDCVNLFNCPVCRGSDASNQAIRQRSPGVCTCQDGYYDDYPNNIDCQDCDDTVCGTCHTNATTCDTACLEGCSNCDLTGVCVGSTCKTGYLHAAGSPVTCTKCHKKCLNCTGDINTCDGCADSTRDNTQNCKCNVGKYSSVVDETCGQTCDYKCLNCTEVTGICIDCADSNRDPSDSCNCVDGYYEDGVNNSTCGKCDYTVCGTCNTNATTCDTPCLVGCGQCNTSGVCIGSTCKTGYLHTAGSPVTCTKCNKKCLNCTGDINTCNGCADSTRDNTQNCKCNVGNYSSVVDETCDQTCDYKCLNCTEVTGVCIDCADSNRDPSDSCNCVDGYYEDGVNNATCGKCDDTVCATCNTNATTCDIPCSEGCGQCDLTGTCIGSTCKTGYLHAAGSPVTCTKCHKKCLNCTGDINTCDGCADSTRDNSQNCKCNVGKYSSVLDETCDQNCDYKCLNCTEVTGTCIDCADSNRDPSNSCNCVDGYYEDGVNNSTCGKCDETVCGTCHTNATTCNIACQEGCSTCDLTGACIGPTCKTGYRFEAGNCIKCNEKCLNCSGDNDTCVGCADSSRDSSQNCKCNIGKYSLVLNQACDQTCSHKCEKCEEVNGNCSTCSDVNRDQSDSCNCKTGYFENGSNNATCGKCSHECETCRSENTCDTCSSVTRNSSDNCSCNPGYYNVAEQQDCVLCQDPCGNCTSPTQCTTCKFPATRSPPTCECQPGEYENGNDCLPCDHTRCATCEISATQCITPCDEGCHLCNPQNQCQKIEKGYYENENGSIAKCDDNCLLCEQFATKCTTCRIGYYLDSTICKKCSEKCSSCTDFDTCQICSSGGLGRTNNLEQNCACQEGYYPNGNSLDCLQCPYNCLKCNENGGCTQCLNGKMLLPECTQSENGKLAVIDQENNTVYTQCSSKCEKCVSYEDNCTVCKNGLFRQSSLPSCACMDGYHDDEGRKLDCERCPLFCRKCLNGDRCEECEEIENRGLNNFSGQCECLKGYKEMNGGCKRCYDFEGECLFDCPVNSQKDEDLFICRKRDSVFADNMVLIYICLGLVLVLLVVCSFVAKFMFSLKGGDRSFKNQISIRKDDRSVSQQQQQQ